MIRRLLLVALLGISYNSFAQRVYWANKVVDFTSELSPVEYSAQQVLGKPNVLPQGGDSPNAWMPAKPNRLEFVTVSFEKPIKIQQIIIAESYNPSAIYEVYLYNRAGTEYLVHTFDPKPLDTKARLLTVFIDKTKYKVYALRLVVDGSKVPGYSAIDAIGVSASNKPYKVKIEEPQNIRENILVEELDQNVNSPYGETRPLISPDGQTLYFSRSHHPDNVGGVKDPNDIWYSERDETSGSWKKAKNIGPPLNNKGPNYISSITPDGNAMTVLLGNEYVKANKMKPGVSISTKSSTGWSEPKPLEIINANIETTDGNYFLANNRKVMIMAIDRYDSYGGKDLYVSFLQKNGKWTEPLNLGNDVNSAHTESSPYLAADNETLYFSSMGFSGYGGADIYISRRLDDTWTNWTEPENLGPDVNSPGDDIFFNIPPSGKYAYFARADKSDAGNINRIEMPIFYQPAPVASVKGVVAGKDNGKPVAAKISYRLMPEKTDVGFAQSDSLTGEYEILLPVGSAYDFTVEAKGYKTIDGRINLSEETDFSEIKRDITLERAGKPAEGELLAGAETPAAGGNKVVSDKEIQTLINKNVYFDFASDYADIKNYPFLKGIADYLKAHPDKKLYISGHSDNVGPDQYNMGLSLRRAKSVLHFFTSQGIPEERFVVKGYGSKRPVATNETREGRAKNRRVDFSLH